MPTESCPRCVLLIEDDQSLREQISAFLEARGYTVVSAEHVERALDLLLDRGLAHPCLVLADLISLRVDWSKLVSALHPEDQLATLPMALVCQGTSARPSNRVKRPVAFDLLHRIVKEHCCGEDGDGKSQEPRRDSVAGSGTG